MRRIPYIIPVIFSSENITTLESPTKQTEVLTDRLDRPLDSLRISVIDRCDLRCNYCMPEEEYTWLPQRDILGFDEILRLVDVFVDLGVARVRLTGGEPLLRGNLVELVQRLAERAGVEDLALTTNATQLERLALPLRRAGLQRVTVSLDSLRADRFVQLTRREALDQVLAGIGAAADVGFDELKINTVVMQDFNDDEIVPLVEFGREVGAEVRFIEYMDVGGATMWNMDEVFSKADILARLQDHYGDVRPQGEQGTAPAQRFALPDGTRLGVIASVTEPFCSTCDRARLTADGLLYLCLYASDGIDLGKCMRSGASDGELRDIIRGAWRERTDRSAEERLDDPYRGTLYQVEELKQDLHREMHTRGG